MNEVQPGRLRDWVKDRESASGGKNKSSLHWDMVCDTRKGFTVYGNGKPIHKNGKFLKT